MTESTRKKIWFFAYNIKQDTLLTVPMTWMQFKRYYDVNGKYPDKYEWIEPVLTHDDLSIDDIINEAISHEADIYMFSSYMWSWDIVKIVAYNVKQKLPNSLVLLGGPHQFTTYSTPILWFKDHPYFDATCGAVDYGEFFIQDLLDQYVEGPVDFNNIRNSYHRKGLGPKGEAKEFKYPPGLIKENMEYLYRIRDKAATINKALTITYETNRGCMYKCSYCEWGGGTNVKLAVKDLDYIKEDLALMNELDIHTMWLADANFGILARDEEIAQLFAQTKVEYLGVSGLTKTSTDKRRKVLAPLFESKITDQFHVSIQSLDPTVLKNIERTDVTPEDNMRLANEMVKKYNINAEIEFIMGLPGTTLDIYYKEAEFVYNILNKANPRAQRHLSLLILPDSPAADPKYIEKHQLKFTPISMEESHMKINNESLYIQQFISQQFKKEPAVLIPVSSYSYTVEDWKQMYFMNEIMILLTDWLLVRPIIDLLVKQRGLTASEVFKRIYKAVTKVDSFYQPVEQGYLNKLLDGGYKETSWKQFEVGPVKGSWSSYLSLGYLWVTNSDRIFDELEKEFDVQDEVLKDCFLYVRNTTMGRDETIIWDNQYRWDLWEEHNDRTILPIKETVTLINSNDEIKWEELTYFFRHRNTRRYSDDSPITVNQFDEDKGYK